MRRLVALALLAACGGRAAPSSSGTPGSPGRASTRDRDAAHAPAESLDWLEGRWASEGAEPSIEHWVRAGDRWVGIGLRASGGRTAGFEVMTIARKGGRLVFTGMPDGRAAVDFAAVGQGGERVEFGNPSHDFPQTVRYWREGGGLRAEAAAPGARTLEYAWSASGAGRAVALEQADLAFAAAVAQRGVDAWVEHFEPEGAQWDDRPVVGREAIRALMAPVFARPGFRLDWKPVASGMSPAGDLGYTVGTAIGSATGRPSFTTVYATIWRRQPDGSWKVYFDVGWVTGGG